MKTNYMMGVIQMEHEEGSAVTDQASINWEDGKLKAQYEVHWRWRWTFEQIFQKMREPRTTLREWMYFQFLLKVLAFKIPHIIFTWEKGRSYK